MAPGIRRNKRRKADSPLLEGYSAERKTNSRASQIDLTTPVACASRSFVKILPIGGPGLIPSKFLHIAPVQQRRRIDHFLVFVVRRYRAGA